MPHLSPHMRNGGLGFAHRSHDVCFPGEACHATLLLGHSSRCFSLSVHCLFLLSIYLLFWIFLLRKWHIFSTSTPPNRPSSKTQTLQERSVSPTASSLIFAIGLQTALNFYYLLTGPSDVCLCATARKWKERPSLCWC